MPIRRPTLFILVLAFVAAGCAGTRQILNSDMIKDTFGSYGVRILLADGNRRVSSLYSLGPDGPVTRTYAVVDFIGEPRPAYAVEHRRILAGGSIGETFRRAGWRIDKQNLFVGELEVPPEYRDIGELMHITLPATLAVQQYLLTISKDERSWNYAIVTEIHHPAYLDAAALKRLYGEILLDDSNRDTLHDFIGPPITN